MLRKIQRGEAVDVSKCSRTRAGDFIMPESMFSQSLDYCDAKAELWIWSIGRERGTGRILASTTTKFYGDERTECLWLR